MMLFSIREAQPWWRGHNQIFNLLQPKFFSRAQQKVIHVTTQTISDGRLSNREVTCRSILNYASAKHPLLARFFSQPPGVGKKIRRKGGFRNYYKLVCLNLFLSVKPGCTTRHRNPVGDIVSRVYSLRNLWRVAMCV